MSFEDLKKKRSSSFEKLNDQLKKMKSGGVSRNDEDYWQITRDAAGNGQATIRFLDAPDGEEFPFVRIWSHSFKGPTGRWYFENSLTTLGEADPVSEYNTELWNTEIESNKAKARVQKRKLTFISNILVIKDNANPENDGKVFLFKYGSKIFDKINDAMNPQFDDEEPFNPFDMFEGADFNLKVREVEGYANYDKSEFKKPTTPVSEDEEKIKEIWSKTKSLEELIDKKNFKSYDELKTKLYQVLGEVPANKRNLLDNNVQETPKGKTSNAKKTETLNNDDEFDEDELAFFNGLDDDE